MGYALYVVISPADIQPVSSNASPPPHFCEFVFPSKVYKYSRVNQSVYHVSCKSSGSDGIQTVGLTDQHEPLRFTLPMQGIRLEILVCLLVCLSHTLSSSLCFHSFSSIAPFFIPYVFFFFCYSELFSWNEAICHKYSHIVYRACFKTYRALYAGREGVRRSLSNIFLNVLLPGDSDDKYLVSVTHS